MENATQIGQQSDRSRSPGQWALLTFALLGAPLSWVVHSASIGLLVPAACEAGNTGAPHWLLTAICAGVSLAALAAGYVIWRGSSGPTKASKIEEEAPTDDASRGGFLSWGGMFTSTMFLLLILIETIPLLVLGPCDISV
jgi:hypothetical protein